MPDSAFEYFQGRQNARIVRLLERNTSVAGFCQSLLEHLVAFSEKEGIDFERIKLETPYIAHDEHIRARITVT